MWADCRSKVYDNRQRLLTNPVGQQAPETAGWKHLTNPLLLTAVSAAQPVDHPLRVFDALGLSISLTGSAPEPESGALFG